MRVVGGAHSWSRIAAPEDIAISLRHLAGVIGIDRERGEVTVRAGTRLGALLEALGAEGLTLPIIGSITEQAIGGLIATGTHGSSLVHGNLASLVTRLRLITAAGDALDIAGDELEGMRVHLGALGVVTTVTLAVTPAFQLAETVENIPIADAPAALATIAASAEYVKLWWMPHARLAQIFRYERTTEPSSPGPRRQRWIDEKLMHRFVFPFVLQLGRLPGLTRPISRVVAKSFAKPRQVGPMALMLSTPMPVRHRETEAAMPLPRAGEALERVVRMIDRERLHVNFIVEARFVRGDRAWLSPAQGADACQLGAYCHGNGSDRYFAAFWREMRAIGARPHWGKELDHTADEIRSLWPHAPQFLALRDRLDPQRMFASEFHERTLGR